MTADLDKAVERLTRQMFDADTHYGSDRLGWMVGDVATEDLRLVISELSRLREENITLTRERDGYRTVAVNMSWNHKVRDSLYSTDEAYRAHQEQLVDECLRNLLATLSRQSKEGGE